VDKRQGWRGAPHHLDDAALEAALPLWRERLAAVQALPGEVVVWDLARAPKDEEPEGDIRSAARVRRLQPDGIYTGLVTTVADRLATVDLGNAAGTIPLATTTWARKYNPTSATREPRRMQDVLKPGDLVPVRVLPGAQPPAALAAAKKPLALALEQVPRVQGALVAIDPETRAVRALVGGYDFQTSQFNRAFQAKRQPGSAFKPFAWGAAIESRRFTPATVVYDTPDVFRDPSTGKDWKPQNFERDAYDGPLLLSTALAHSKNTVAVKLVDSLGPDAVAAFARRLGVQSELPLRLSLALGTGEVTPLELVNAYATIAARGFPAQPVLVRRVKDRDGHVLEEHAEARPPPPAAAALPVTPASLDADPEARPAPPPDPSAAPAPPPDAGCDPAVAHVLASMMREVVEAGTGAGARALGRPVAAKTGTAQEHRDAWFVGFTPELVAGVWVGFDSHEPMGPRETGAGAALPAWLSFMERALAPAAPREWPPPPAGVEVHAVDPRTGFLASEGAAEAKALPFLEGTAPTQVAGQVDASPQNFFGD
jgi:penicillin-binding protein 1A